MEWITEWAGQLADTADHVLKQVPEKDEWNVLRHFLRNVSNMLRKKSLRAGVKVMMRLLPYIGRTVSGIEKCNNMESSYDVTETIARHFLVDNEAKENLEAFMDKLKIKIDLLRQKIEDLSHQLDQLLEDTFCDGKPIGLFVTFMLAFQMNRISALLHSCEHQLTQARGMIDALDSHVAGKSFLANLTSLVTFIFGIVFSAGGNVPAAAACMTVATASRKSAQNLESYRKQLAAIDNTHHQLETELTEWKHRFKAERRNFILLFGFQRLLLFFAISGCVLLFAGKAINLALYAAFFVFFVVKSEETNDYRYYAAVCLGVVSLLLQVQVEYGLVIFNTAAGTLFMASCLGLIDPW